MGGEKKRLVGLSSPIRGSPPRGRGKACNGAVAVLTVRITPAWAGKSAVSKRWFISKRDHPRVGGEKSSDGHGGDMYPGSPPRGRGKVATWVKARMREGITPAWAGKSRDSWKF